MVERKLREAEQVGSFEGQGFDGVALQCGQEPRFEGFGEPQLAEGLLDGDLSEAGVAQQANMVA